MESGMTINEDDLLLQCLSEYIQLNASISTDRKTHLIKLAGLDKRGKYESSTEWGQKREIVLRAYGNRCVFCGKVSSSLEAHHNSYVRFGNENFSDLIPLCEECHAKAPDSLNRKRKKNKRKIRIQEI